MVNYSKIGFPITVQRIQRAGGMYWRIALVLLPTMLSCSLLGGNPPPVTSESTLKIPTNSLPPPTITEFQPTETLQTTEEIPAPTSTETLAGPSPTMPPPQGSFTLTFDYSREVSDNPAASIDLDTMVPGDGPESDLRFLETRGSGVFYYLYPMHDALGISLGKTSANLEECTNSRDRLTNQVIVNISKGNYLCLLTNQERLILLQIVGTRYVDDDITEMQFNYFQ
jgi:hypothetical protein